MSQSPTDSAGVTRAAADPASPFRQNLSRLNRLIDAGASFSGYERNCAFLNLGPGEKFATASAISGFDFDDDARAIGLCDWDRDGDLDAWVQNRSAPMLRYLRNDSPTGNRSLQLRLRGVESNRDAIGARVELLTASGRKLVQTLKAGEGFLSQSSKWLHFGLGSADEIRSLSVRWPNGSSETIAGAKPGGGRYTIAEGSGKAVAAAPIAPGQRLAAGGTDLPRSASASRTPLAARLPIPTLNYQTFSGEDASIPTGAGRPLLINLWASWCAPCVAELKVLDQRKAELDKAGLKVIALSADGLSGEIKTGAADAAALAKKLGLTIPVGMATRETVRRIELLHNLPFGLAGPPPVPTSLLIDRSGGLAAVYRGAVEVDSVLQDLAALDLEGEALLDWPLAFSGHRWIARAFPQGYFAIPIDLIENGHLEETAKYFKIHHQRLANHDPKRLSFLHGQLGMRLVSNGQLAAGITAYEAALAIDPNNIEASNNLAWQLAACTDKQLRNGARAVQLAELAAKATAFKHPAVLDTLAAALAQDGRFKEALAIARRGADIARAAGQSEFLQSLENGIGFYLKGLPYGG